MTLAIAHIAVNTMSVLMGDSRKAMGEAKPMPSSAPIPAI
jgi:hypothetical protein